MNREIKFRAWNEEEKKMIQWHDCFFYDTSEVTQWSGDFSYIDMPLMQYTGLKDKSGKEIYEGDIVHAYTAESNGYGKEDYISAEIEGIVTYKGISFGIQVGEIFNDLWIHAETFEVIGNIYENKDLIKSYPNKR